MNRFLFILVYLLFASCNATNKKAKEVINRSIDEASLELQTENLKLKENLTLVYNNLLKSSSDTSIKSKAILLFERFSKTDGFIDSLQNVIIQLDRDDATNVETIKELLAVEGLGDRLYQYLSNTFIQAKDFSIKQEKKKAIDSLRMNVFKTSTTEKSWQEELFGMTNPMAASLILFALQKELYKVVEIALKQ